MNFHPRHRMYAGFVAVILTAAAGFSFFYLAQAQQETQGTTLLREFFLPIQGRQPIEAGRISINGTECLTVGTSSCVGNDVDPSLGFGTNIDSAAGARKTVDGLALDNEATISYQLNIAEPASYQLRLNGKNNIDSLSKLTRNQYDQIKSVLPPDYPSLELPTLRELAVRELHFNVSLSAAGAPPVQLGVLKLKDINEFNTASIELGALQPASYTLTLAFIDDMSVVYPSANNPCGAASACSNFTVCLVNPADEATSTCQLPGTDNNLDGILDKTPVINRLEISKTELANDVIGVRVYTNPENLSSQDWYQRKILRPAVPVPFVVDGYRGVLDGRTAYINAANVTNDGDFYTNIYVIAYNVNASPAAINIYGQLLDNWKFNQNLIAGLNEVEAERIKDQLRRDTIRLEDLVVIREALDRYRLNNQKYPDLQAGTFLPGHVISTWPTWQSVLGTQLGLSLPVDPINKLALESYPSGSPYAVPPRQYDCANPAEADNCEVVCSRSAENVALTGCQADQQCVGTEYCSLVPPGYDAMTGWNETAQRLAFTELPQFGLYAEGSFNTNGLKNTLASGRTDPASYKDDAFVFQYTSVDGGNSYVINYRLEFQGRCQTTDASTGRCTSFTLARCLTGQCFDEADGSCVESGDPRLTGDLQYCFAGTFINSCGNGIIQTEAGEQCEPSQGGTAPNFCDETYGSQAWYNKTNINPGCTATCQLVTEAEVGNLPVPYNAQNPALSCGGYCGDTTIQFEAGEQCDQGVVGGVIPLPNEGGSGGVSADAQYVCNGAAASQSGAQGLVEFNTTISSAPVSAVREVNPNLAYNLTFNTALPTGQGILSVLIEEIDQLGATTSTSQKNITTASAAAAPRAFSFVTRSTTQRVRITFSAQNYTATVSNAALEGVKGCSTFGGWCGDGGVQTSYGEECDILSYQQPTPALSVNQFRNPGFENGLENWLAVDNGGVPQTAQNFLGTQLTIERVQRNNIKTGSSSLIFKPTAQAAGLGEQVFYSPNADPATPNTLTATVWAKRIVPAGEVTPPTLALRAYQYDFDRGVIVPFSNGSQFLEANMQAVNEEGQALTSPDTTYRAFISSALAIPTATGDNLNNVTLVQIAVKGDFTNKTFYLDDLAINSNFKLQYQCGQRGSQSCQLLGGFCGDNIVQTEFGETCDKGPNGDATCSPLCAFPSCGDGVVGKMTIGNNSIDELCDPTDPTDDQSPYCLSSCQQKKLGGSCEVNSNECTTGTICAKRGDSDEAICTLTPGQKGCSTDDHCVNGFYCELQSGECLPQIPLYLKYHLDPAGFPLEDPNPSAEGNFFCPYIVTPQERGAPIIKDGCTGLEFRALDQPINGRVNHDEAVDQCATGGRGFVLPAAKQLFALSSAVLYVDTEDGSQAYAPNDDLRLCALHGEVTSAGGNDKCLEETAEEGYVYWTDTPYQAGGKRGDAWNQYYAVNFKTGSLEVYDWDAKIRSRCLSTSSCGNGVVEREEQCEFNSAGQEILSNISCTDRGFSAGNVHCDVNSCKFRFDNCVAYTTPSSQGEAGESCTDACARISRDNYQVSICSLQPSKSCATNANCQANTCDGATGVCTVTRNNCSSDANCQTNTCVPDVFEPKAYGVEMFETFPDFVNKQTEYTIVGDNNYSAYDGAACGIARFPAISGADLTTVRPADDGSCALGEFADGQPVFGQLTSPRTLCTCNIPDPDIAEAPNEVQFVSDIVDGLINLENYNQALQLLDEIRTDNCGTGAECQENFENAAKACQQLSSAFADEQQNCYDQLNLLAIEKVAAAEGATDLALSGQPNLTEKLIDFIKKVFSLINPAFAASTSSTIANMSDAQAKYAEAQVYVDALPPSPQLIDPNAVLTIPANTTWPLTDPRAGENQLLVKLWLLGRINSVYMKINLQLGEALASVITTTSSRASVEAAFVVASDLSSMAAAGADELTHIPNDSQRADYSARATALLSSVQAEELVESCLGTLPANTDWSLPSTNAERSKYRVKYNGTAWQTTFDPNVGELSITYNTNSSTPNACYYTCNGTSHRYSDGSADSCVSNICSGSIPDGGVGTVGNLTGPADSWKIGTIGNECEWNCDTANYRMCSSQCLPLSRQVACTNKPTNGQYTDAGTYTQTLPTCNSYVGTSDCDWECKVGYWKPSNSCANTCQSSVDSCADTYNSSAKEDSDMALFCTCMILTEAQNNCDLSSYLSMAICEALY